MFFNSLILRTSESSLLAFSTLLIGFTAALAAYNFGFTTERLHLITVPLFLLIAWFGLLFLFAVVKVLFRLLCWFYCLAFGHHYGQPISLGPDSGDYGDHSCTRCGAEPPDRN